MSPENLSRRTILAGAASSPALALPAVASAASGSDSKLRRLWGQYLELAAEYDTVRAKSESARAAYDVEEPACPEGVLPGQHYRDCQPLWRKYGLDELYDQRNRIDTAIRETIVLILNTPAEGLFGIGVKLSAQLHPTSHDYDDWVESVAVALDDIDRVLGRDEFSARHYAAHDVQNYLRSWEESDDEEAAA